MDDDDGDRDDGHERSKQWLWTLITGCSWIYRWLPCKKESYYDCVFLAAMMKINNLLGLTDRETVYVYLFILEVIEYNKGFFYMIFFLNILYKRGNAQN